MTVKRFEVTFNDSDFHLKDNETGEELKLVDEKVCYDYIANRWNVLHKENEYLHKYNTKLQKQPLLFDVQTIPDTIEIIEVLNQLEKENEQLRTKNNAYIQDIEVFKEENTHLKLENEQLKQFQDRVFSWIDMHLQRLPTLRDDEFESDNEFADPSLYSGAIQILETMKKELKGDVE